ncbi:MAG: metallo-beta-lactamase family protein [bacterium]|nr:MAG: metallo-beta-lactamase family protein [bacterium]KAF0148360.1 MAG: metallo-beta-lactamase family protein [bacterium]KAF0167821.1 MAG: metallo-beta-lactamase family protein [bacterium]TXT18969.1 MAG: metallo-beta-lactamase family protein [bacterium]
MKLSFHGAARQVTGSCFLVESEKLRFIVDCGMFQGGRDADARNRRFPTGFEPEDIDFVLLTHAHIDHSGLLPRLCALGYRGPIHCTRATSDLLGVLLPDSAFIQEKEAEWANYAHRKSRQRHKSELAPLYTVTQAREALKRVKKVGYDQEIRPHARVRVKFRDAGHILGSAILEVWVEEGGRVSKLVFSGDLGMPGRPLLNDPTPIEEADVLLVESTYGNRLHKSLRETEEELAQAVNDTLTRKGGNVIIPAFAVGRTQELLYLLMDLVRRDRLPHNLAIFVDSPMAGSATEITLRHGEVLDAETRDLLAWYRSSPEAPYLRVTEDAEDSMALNKIRQGAIIISASGMCDAGRIKHHLKFNLPRPECTVIIAGFQAEGTLGRRLVDGAKSVRIFRETVPVRADLYTLGGLSAHADRDALVNWLSNFKRPPRRTFVVHGEEETAQGFAALLREGMGWRVEVPEMGAEYLLD